MNTKLFTVLGGLILLSLLTATGTLAQGVIVPFEEWTTQEGTQNFFHKCVTKTDANRNVYVAGATKNSSGNYDILLAKYDYRGVQQWVSQYAGAGNGDDLATNLEIDGSGNSYIVGLVYTSAQDCTDVITMKYNSSGVQQWAAIYDGGQGRSDGGAGIWIDNGDVYVSGSTYTGSTDLYDFLTIKYNSSGTQQWVATWDNVDMWDGAHQIEVKSNQVNVSGGTQTASLKYEYATIAYDLSGNYVGSSVTSGNNPIGFSKVFGMATDASGNIYITGGTVNSNFDIYTVKLNSSLSIQWSATYNGASNLDDVGHDIKVDGSGNVYVVGLTTATGQGQNYVTIKYNSSGTQQWAQTYNAEANSDDIAYAVAENGGNIYVTGSAKNKSSIDYYTIKYDGSGNLKWGINYNSLTTSNDKATSICIDNSGDIIVAGQSQVSGAYNYTTVKYVEKSIITPPDPVALSTHYYYTENRGQLLKNNGQTYPEVRYYNHQSKPRTYYTDYNVSYVFCKEDTITTSSDSLFRVDMNFVNYTTGKVRAMDMKSVYNNYFYPHISTGRARVQNYSRLVFPDLYSNIDVMYGSYAGGMKYYFIIKPGGTPGSILWNYTGASSVSINGSGALVISTPLGNLTMPKAAAFQIDANGNYVSLSWQPSYNIPASTNVNFTNIGTYDNTKALVFAIDWGTVPTATSANDWSTYWGESGFDQGWALNSDGSGNAYFAGETDSPNFPSTVGSVLYSATQGGRDAFISKIDPIGAPIWGTYYGGNANDIATGIDLNSSNDVYITGQTASNNWPGAANSLQGNTDAFVLRLDNAGSAVLWTRYIGGNNDDEARGVAIDGSNNVYIAGKTHSSSSFPTMNKSTTGAYNQSTSYANTTYCDGFIVEYDASNTQLWGTFFGGTDMDNIADIEVGANDRIFVSGSTFNSVYASSNGSNPVCGVPINGSYFPDCNAGGTTYHQAWGGGIGSEDAFIAEFNSGGVMQWSTYLGGQGNETSRLIRGSRIALNPQNLNILYLVGTSGKDAGFPISGPTGSYLQFFGQSGTIASAYITKFNSRVFEWGSFFGCGGSGGTFGFDVTTDNYNNVYITGNTGVTTPASSSNYCIVPPYNNFPQCAGNGMYWQVNGSGVPVYNGGVKEGYAAAFNSANKLVWSTWYGGNANEQPNAIHSDIVNNRIYITGITQSTASFPLLDPTGNNYQQNANNLGGPNNNQDAFLARFEANPINSIAEVQTEIGQLLVYPNPSAGQFTVEFTLNEKAETQLQVFNSIGQLVYQEELRAGVGLYKVNIDLESMSNGLYFIQIVSGNKAGAARIIKQ